MSVKNKFFATSYRWLLKPIFFALDPERVHDHMTSVGSRLGATQLGRGLTKASFFYANPVLAQDILGIHFSNPIGLAAGFDKNAQLINILPEVGFGFMEVGSITGEPGLGNEKPRLWRLPQSKSLVVNYGLKNDGCVTIHDRVTHLSPRIPIGISAAKTNSPATVELQAGIDDYLKVITTFADSGDYLTINISCPNAFGGLPFCDPERLEQLLQAMNQLPKTKPTFLKLSPDITEVELDKTIDLALRYHIDGLISSNLTKNRELKEVIETNLPKSGGLSGQPVEALANGQISRIYQRSKGKLVVIGCGGVFSAEDAYRKIRLGASLIQLITGMIYQGPQLISEINQGLVELLKKDGFSSVSEAIGVDNR